MKKSELNSDVAALPLKGKPENVSWQITPDGKIQVASLKMADGTPIERVGTSHRWVANPTSETPVKWQGDVSLKPDGTAVFTYPYEKAESHASLELQLSDGSKVAAVGPNGALSIPDATLQATNQRLAETALQSIKSLELNISPDRLHIQGVTTSGIIQTHYILNATPAESTQILAAVRKNPSFKIVPPDQPLASATTLLSSPATISGAPDVGENQAGSYQYSEPRADHTSSVSFLFQEEDGSWKTLTGQRKRSPALGKEALPGGFLDMKNGVVEAPEHAAAREVAEETGLKINNPVLLRVGDALDRDDRNRVIDFQYAAFGTKADLATMKPMDDLKDLRIRDVQSLLSNPESLAFDHYQVLQDAYKLALERQGTARP